MSARYAIYTYRRRPLRRRHHRSLPVRTSEQPVWQLVGVVLLLIATLALFAALAPVREVIHP